METYTDWHIVMILMINHPSVVTQTQGSWIPTPGMVTAENDLVLSSNNNHDYHR
jgi:hypothetical protein